MTRKLAALPVATSSERSNDGELAPMETRLVRRRLREWFEKNARNLPWRGTRDLYRIWVSEIMLQQTQVATVIPYYKRFIERFPNVRAVAEAQESELLRYWEGLGYYRRARQLHLAAKAMVRDHGGEFPESPQDVARLPGIGRYTVGAILSIGRDLRLPIVEANSMRVLLRLAGIEGDPSAKSIVDQVWRVAESLLPKTQVGVHNQALMEIGSLICTPKKPLCHACPLSRACRSFRHGKTSVIPSPKKAKNYEPLVECALVIRDADRYLMRKSQPEERWAGLWDFPRYISEIPQKKLPDDTELIAWFRARYDLAVKLNTEIGRHRYGVTKYRIELTVREAKLISHKKVRGRGTRARTFEASAFQWKTLDELQSLPLNVTARKIFQRLREEPSN